MDVGALELRLALVPRPPTPADVAAAVLLEHAEDLERQAGDTTPGTAVSRPTRAVLREAARLAVVAARELTGPLRPRLDPAPPPSQAGPADEVDLGDLIRHPGVPARAGGRPAAGAYTHPAGSAWACRYCNPDLVPTTTTPEA